MTGNEVVPTSTVLQARVMLYQPSLCPREMQGDWITTSFGRCRVNGRLGQRHADVVEAIMYTAERKREISDGGIELLVDPAKVRRILSDHNYSLSRLQSLLKDLRSATVEIVTPELELSGDRIIGGLIDHVIPSPKTRYNPLTRGERHLWRVRLGIALVMLLERSLNLYYSPEPIARLQHGVSQAVARHVLTHQNNPSGGWYTDTLLRAVHGQNITSMDLRNGRRRLKEDREGLKMVGIQLCETATRIMRTTAA